MAGYGVLRLNLSYVLHERSTSAAVTQASLACQRHAAWLVCAHLPALPATVDGELPVPVDVWLTANVGAPALLQAALSNFGATTWPVVRVDSVGEGLAPPATGRSHMAADDLAIPASASRDPTQEGQAPPLRSALFFRAPARLALPDGNVCVGIATLLVRPGGRTTQLALRGPFTWPEQEDEVVRALERLIQAYAGQWMPERGLWDLPAELLLPGEIL